MSSKWIQFGSIYKKDGKLFMTVNKNYEGGVNAGDLLTIQPIDKVYENLVKSNILSEDKASQELENAKDRGVAYRVSKAPAKD